ncbi:MAG: ATP-binding protein [Ruminococcus sp.]|nr:ATP-binding protein [Ruminococcus sp.]
MENGTVAFEENYIFRANRSITSNSDIALTEFVANAWDAGAHNVSITIPDKENEEIAIEDDGIGMSDAEFHERWMTLNYNRQKRQGAKVVFPNGVEKSVRIAYGRNGVGRHGMLCFANNYTVETWKDGCCNIYDISISHGSSPFKIVNHKTENKQGHGTRIYTFVSRHLPDAAVMTDVLSARFLYDPCFSVKINDKYIDLSQHKGIIYQKDFTCNTNVTFSMIVIDSEKTAAKSQQHGVAFWVSGRLVGHPSWSYSKVTFLDGRLKAAKRYTIIVKTNDLIDDVLPDWSGFIESPNMISVYKCVKQEVDTFIKLVMAEHLNEIRIDAIKNASDELGSLTISGKRNVSAFIEKVTEDNPVINPDYLHTAIEALVSIEKAKRGEELLSQLGQMSPDQIDKLSEILSNWNVDDIATIISEIDKRILVIEAMQRIYNDKNTEELHTLHPLVLNSRWLFGAQFDSPMFVSNSALSTVVSSLFTDSDYDMEEINNPKRRPDIVCLKNYSLKAVCTERIDHNSGEIMKPDQILIVEVKRGGFEITDKEVNQIEYYVRQIRKSSVLHSSATIDAFVVGAKLGDIDPEKETSSGRIHAVTYGHLVDTASGKLFRLRERLQEHYNSLGQESIVEQALNVDRQLKISITV